MFKGHIYIFSVNSAHALVSFLKANVTVIGMSVSKIIFNYVLILREKHFNVPKSEKTNKI